MDNTADLELERSPTPNGRIPILNGHHVLILAESGKPIFSSCGNESDLAATFALIQVFVLTFKSWQDQLLNIEMDDLHIHFSHRSPLIFCVIAEDSSHLTLQMDLIYNQLLSILSKTVLKRVFEERGENFDLRRWLPDIDKRVDVCMNSFVEDPVVYLSGFRILPMSFTDREFLVNNMATAINESSKSVVFSVLIAHRQLVAFVRMKQLDLKAPDFNILANLVECHQQSLRNAPTWVPICLPHFNQNFLYAFVYYLWEDEGPVLIMLSTDRNAFFELQEAYNKLSQRLVTYKRLDEIKATVSLPKPTLRVQTHPELWHFMYKNSLSSQVCCSSPSKPFITVEEQTALYKGYFRVQDSIKKSKNLRIFFLQLEEYTLFAWITGSFELYAAFSPLVSHSVVTETAERLLRLLRKDEKRIFFNVSPGLLTG